MMHLWTNIVTLLERRPEPPDIVRWIYLTGTSFFRDDMRLVRDQSYYVNVQARNRIGLWSINGVSNKVVGGVPNRNLYLPQICR